MDSLLIQVKLAQSGDNEAFMTLISPFKVKISQIAARFGKDEHETRDLTQEIFLEAWKSLPSFKNKAPFEHWLSKIALNRCHRYLKKQYAMGKKNTTALLHDTEDHSSDALNQKEAAEVLHFGMRQLKPNEALVIALKELEHYSIQEIASKMNWSRSKVKVTLHRGKKHLKTILLETKQWP